jgi:transposase InsO family protein
LPHHDNEVGVPSAKRPYQVVEFDGHRLDIRLKVVVRDQLGFEHEFEIERVWLLAIIDVCTRAVLGYHIALGREYSRYDVIKTIENALEPHQTRSFTIAGLAFDARDGFPSQRLPELGYVTWEWMKLDNAKATGLSMTPVNYGKLSRRLITKPVSRANWKSRWNHSRALLRLCLRTANLEALEATVQKPCCGSTRSGIAVMSRHAMLRGAC